MKLELTIKQIDSRMKCSGVFVSISYLIKLLNDTKQSLKLSYEFNGLRVSLMVISAAMYSNCI